MDCHVFLLFFLKELGSPSRADALGGDSQLEAWGPAAAPQRLRCVDTFRGYVGLRRSTVGTGSLGLHINTLLTEGILHIFFTS